MRRLSFVVIAFMALPMISGCVTIKVDERTAFAPPKRLLGPATTVAELDARMVDRFKSGVDEGIWQMDSTPDGAFVIVFREDFPRKQGSVPSPLKLRNGFIGEGEGRVAWTYYSRYRAEDSPRDENRPLVVHCAGNAGDRYNSGANYAVKALPWADVLVFDYPGYGDTPGPTSAVAFESVARKLSDYVILQSENRKLVFWGQSLGGFVCSQLAADIPTSDGLILETTAPNATAVAKAWTPNYARLFVRTRVAPSLARYDVVNAAAHVKGPVLVLGAAKDEVLPVALARQVADGLKSRKANVTYKEFPNATHMNVPSQADFNSVIGEFFKSVESNP